MSKYSVSDDHEWDDEKQQENGRDKPRVRVGMHFLEIYDERECIERYNGLVWSPVLDEGTITAVAVDHYCPGPSHTDPMGYRAWGDVPAIVQREILTALNVRNASEVVDIEATREVADSD